MCDLDKVITALNARKDKPNHWMAHCPAHRDNKESLSISVVDNKILLKCMAGCNTKDVLEASGLAWADISDKAETKLTVWDRITFGMEQNYGEGVFIKEKYPYMTEDGKYLYTKVRFEGGSIKGKEIRYYTINEAADEYKPGRPEGCPKVLYRLPKVIESIEKGYPINIVEGEKDVHTLERFGWTATTTGGTNDWNREFAKYFKGAEVRIFPDNDEPGEKLANRIARDLRTYAYKVTIVKTSKAEKGDVTDYLNEGGHNKETLTSLISEAEHHYSPWVKFSKNSESVNVDILAKTFSDQENYLIIRGDNSKTERIYSYENGVYKPSAANSFKSRIREYFGYGKATPNALDNTYKMIICRNEHVYSPEILNSDEYLINLKNGLLDVRTMKFGEHNPKHLGTIQLDLNYDPEAKYMPSFTKYINDLCLNDSGEVDTDKLCVIQEVLGLALSNICGYRIKKAVFLYSPVGNSGKSQLINLIQKIIGQVNCSVIQIRDMVPEHRFSLAKLPHTRLIICGDQTAADVKDSSIFKQLTGGDMVKVEGKGEDAFSFMFKGLIIYGCNSFPVFEDDKGDHLFERLLLIPCLHTVPEKERDVEMINKMFSERSAIFNWALEGLKRMMANNYHFTECEAVNNTVTDFRKKVDTVQRFLNESGYIITHDRRDTINAKELFEKYKEWADDEENEVSLPISKSGSFADRLASYGVKKGKQSVMVFYGIKEDFHDPLDDNIPF